MGVFSNDKIAFSNINNSNEFVSCGRFFQFANKQGLGCPFYKLLQNKEIKWKKWVAIKNEKLN